MTVNFEEERLEVVRNGQVVPGKYKTAISKTIDEIHSDLRDESFTLAKQHFDVDERLDNFYAYRHSQGVPIYDVVEDSIVFSFSYGDPTNPKTNGRTIVIRSHADD